MPAETFTSGRLPLALAAALLLTAGCGQKLTAGGALTTQVGNLEDTTKCRHLGNVKVSVRTELYAVRKDQKIAEDLLAKARNIASEVGIDTVVPLDEIADGGQSFGLYICGAGS